MRAGKIYCPKCQWLPQPSDLWMCEPACGCLWNTFETDGFRAALDKDGAEYAALLKQLGLSKQ